MHSRTLILLLLFVCSVARAGSDEAERVASFLATLAPVPDGAIPFLERRMSSLLTEPIEVRGELRIGKDGVIDKRVTSPVEERVQITARTLTLERKGTSRTVNLAGDPRWQAFHAGITGLMNRDPAALDRAFTVRLEEGPQGWILELRPKGPRRKNMVELISASGRGPNLLGLRLDQGGGEWQEMSFLLAGS
ncbi:MAG: LolA-related protein [Gammaproteobacteria bacterium]